MAEQLSTQEIYQQFQENLLFATETAANLQEAAVFVAKVLDETTQKFPDVGIAFVSGVVTSEGEDRIPVNMAMLDVYTKLVGENLTPFAFSASTVFDKGRLFSKFDTAGATNKDYLDFWSKVVSRASIKKFVFTPNFQRSLGSMKEFRSGLKLGKEMFYINEQLIIIPMTEDMTNMALEETP